MSVRVGKSLLPPNARLETDGSRFQESTSGRFEAQTPTARVDYTALFAGGPFLVDPACRPGPRN